MLAAARERQHVAIEALEQGTELRRARGSRLRQALAHLAGRGTAQRRRVVLGEAADEHVHGAVAEVAHRLRIHGQRVAS